MGRVVLVDLSQTGCLTLAEIRWGHLLVSQRQHLTQGNHLLVPIQPVFLPHYLPPSKKSSKQDESLVFFLKTKQNKGMTQYSSWVPSQKEYLSSTGEISKPSWATRNYFSSRLDKHTPLPYAGHSGLGPFKLDSTSQVCLEAQLLSPLSEVLSIKCLPRQHLSFGHQLHLST